MSRMTMVYQGIYLATEAVLNRNSVLAPINHARIEALKRDDIALSGRKKREIETEVSLTLNRVFCDFIRLEIFDFNITHGKKGAEFNVNFHIKPDWNDLLVDAGKMNYLLSTMCGRLADYLATLDIHLSINGVELPAETTFVYRQRVEHQASLPHRVLNRSERVEWCRSHSEIGIKRLWHLFFCHPELCSDMTVLRSNHSGMVLVKPLRRGKYISESPAVDDSVLHSQNEALRYLIVLVFKSCYKIVMVRPSRFVSQDQPLDSAIARNPLSNYLTGGTPLAIALLLPRAVTQELIFSSLKELLIDRAVLTALIRSVDATLLDMIEGITGASQQDLFEELGRLSTANQCLTSLRNGLSEQQLVQLLKAAIDQSIISEWIVRETIQGAIVRGALLELLGGTIMQPNDLFALLQEAVELTVSRFLNHAEEQFSKRELSFKERTSDEHRLRIYHYVIQEMKVIVDQIFGDFFVLELAEIEDDETSSQLDQIKSAPLEKIFNSPKLHNFLDQYDYLVHAVVAVGFTPQYLRAVGAGRFESKKSASGWKLSDI